MSERDDIPRIKLVSAPADSPSAPWASRRRDAESVSYLRLVSTVPEPAQNEPARKPSRKARAQLPLFSGVFDTLPSLLVFLDMSMASDAAFTAMVRELRPRWLLDLRPAPRFDYGRLNRRLAFRLFADNGVSYRDIAGSLRIQDRHDARLHAGSLSRELSELLARSSQALTGPIMFLVDAPSVLHTAKEVLPKTLEPRPKVGWSSRTITVHGERYFLE